jgi:hypothetical protein
MKDPYLLPYTNDVINIVVELVVSTFKMVFIDTIKFS